MRTFRVFSNFIFFSRLLFISKSVSYPVHPVRLLLPGRHCRSAVISPHVTGDAYLYIYEPHR